MAKRCGPNNRCSYPRAQFWRQALGIDYYSQSGRAAFDEDYQAILDAATAFGYTLPTSAQQIKENTCMEALNAAGLLAKAIVGKMFKTDGSEEYATLDW